MPISRRWRFIIRKVAFFCFLSREHVEVNVDLSLWPKKETRGLRGPEARAGLSLARGAGGQEGG